MLNVIMFTRMPLEKIPIPLPLEREEDAQARDCL
jgi:hypothetical protein